MAGRWTARRRSAILNRYTPSLDMVGHELTQQVRGTAASIGVRHASFTAYSRYIH